MKKRTAPPAAQPPGVPNPEVDRLLKRIAAEFEQLSRQLKLIAPGRNDQARIRSVVANARGRLTSADIAHEFIGGSIAGCSNFSATCTARCSATRWNCWPTTPLTTQRAARA